MILDMKGALLILNIFDLAFSTETYSISECVRCEKILRLCAPPCPGTETCVVTRQTCHKCGAPYCIPNEQLGRFCELNPVAICIDPEGQEGLCSQHCKKSR